jgi:hypothetical protein
LFEFAPDAVNLGFEYANPSADESEIVIHLYTEDNWEVMLGFTSTDSFANTGCLLLDGTTDMLAVCHIRRGNSTPNRAV